jgi:hypothetical protein
VLRRARIGCFALLAVAIAFFGVLHFIRRPSNIRDWSPDQRVLASAEFRAPLVTVHNIRFCTYRTASDSRCSYYDKTFDLRQLDSVWFAVEPFGVSKGAAHTFVSFGFHGRDFLAVSVEIRKERGESFSALRGLLREYELMYVVGDERDLIKLRTNYRRDPVRLYPIRATHERMRRMFVDMLARANDLRAHPEFYNTLTNTCTTNIVRHVNTVAPGKVPFSLAILFPGYSDQLAWRIGLIETDLPFETARERYLINARAERYAEDPEFSQKIRSGAKRPGVR